MQYSVGGREMKKIMLISLLSVSCFAGNTESCPKKSKSKPPKQIVVDNRCGEPIKLELNKKEPIEVDNNEAYLLDVNIYDELIILLGYYTPFPIPIHHEYIGKTIIVTKQNGDITLNLRDNE